MYKRYSDYDLDNPTTLGDKVYFATYIAKLRRFFPDAMSSETAYLYSIKF